MDLRKLKTLIDLVSESGISELEITEGDGKVRIVKNAPPVMMVPSAAPVGAAPVIATPSTIAGAPPAGGAATPGAGPAPETPAGHVVRSPMVGTFYRSAQPGAEPFVSVGSEVAEGDTLCIIEAMKLMNEIVSEYDGEIVEAFVESGQPVQYGERLFAIRAS